MKVKRLIGKTIADRYFISKKIGAGGMGEVFRAMPFSDPSQDVAIKIIRSDQNLGSEALLRFQKEAALMSRLHHPNIICFHELGLLKTDEISQEQSQGYYIVMEIADGKNLKENLSQGSRKDLAFFFEVSLQVVAALDYTHGKNITHHDIKPQNIIIGKAWQEQRGIIIKVLDFGVARLSEVTNLAKARSHTSPEDIVGTPMYMAPEQTPYFDAPIDHRVDLYSLGCVLYEILAGKTPFTADTKEKLMRHHVNTMPEPLSAIRPDVPKVIEEIIHKLLAKHPDDRYQSAFGLIADLTKAKTIIQNKSKYRELSFKLGQKDRFKAVSANLELVGRGVEYNQLIDSYKAISEENERSRLSVITGDAGVGKTRLLTEFRSYLAVRKIRYISTSFSRHENNLPFNALANGFNEYLIRVLKTQPHEAEELMRKIKTLLGPMALLVADVVPGLKAYITPDFEELKRETNPEEKTGGEDIKDFQKFAKAFSDFTRCLATNNQPIVFIFDDMQWADDKSLDLIDQFFSHNNSQRFFLVIGHRPINPDRFGRFTDFLAKFQKLRRRYQEIHLHGFDRASIRLLIENTTGLKKGINDDLINHLEITTAGNPMYLVEMTRNMIANEKIKMNFEEGRLEYNSSEITGSSVKLNSIDLTLSRISNYGDEDRKILEIASTIGMTFQFELLLLEGTVQVNRARSALQHAINEGLILRSPEEQELKILGKTFTFTHRRAREAINDEIDDDRKAVLHELILNKLESTIPLPSEKTIFTLAHHVNRALSFSEGKQVKKSLAEKGIKHNIQAGKAAMSKKSWESAQQYYENAHAQLNSLTSPSLELKIRVIEQLAEIAVFQSNSHEALKKFNTLLEISKNYRISNSNYTSILLRSLNLLLLRGDTYKALLDVNNGLRHLGLRVPVNSSWFKWRLYFQLIRDIGFSRIKSSHLFKALRYAFVKGTQLRQRNEKIPYSGIELYHLGGEIGRQVSETRWRRFHVEAMSIVVANLNLVSPEVIVRTVGDRALLLGQLGFFTKSYYLLDVALDIAENLHLKHLHGYLLLQRTLMLDHYKGKYEETVQNVKIAMTHLCSEYDKIHYGMGAVYLLYSDLFKGKIDEVIVEAKNLIKSNPVWNSISPKAVAIVLLAMLLKGARIDLVSFGEKFLRRRRENNKQKRILNPYISIIEAIVAWARGEFDKTREAYSTTVQIFSNDRKLEQLYPFEEDFISFFILTFPELYLYEHGEELLVIADMKIVLARLQAKARGFRNNNRTISKLVLARHEEVNRGEKIKYLYDQVILSSRINTNIIVQLFTYFWFGRFLLSRGESKRKRYIINMYQDAAKLNLMLLVDISAKLLAKLEIPFREVQEQGNLKNHEIAGPRTLSPIISENLEKLGEMIKSPEALEDNINEILDSLKRHYSFSKASCFLVNPTNEDELIPLNCRTIDDRNKEIASYITPYLNIRSSLFLPKTDAPWHRSSGDQTMAESCSTKASGREHSMKTIIDEPTIANHSFNPVSSNLDDTSLLETSTNNHKNNEAIQLSMEKFTTLRGGFKVDNKIEHSMNTLIPIRFNQTTLGVIFLEDFEFSKLDMARCRQDFDQFGIEMGLVVNIKRNLNRAALGETINPTLQQFLYEPGKFLIEDVKWLDIWSRGKLRKERESVWYLGLNMGPKDYLLAYCRLNGPLNIRNNLSSMIWHYFYVLCSSARALGRNTMTADEWRDEFVALLKSRPQNNLLQNISLTFTIFNGDEKTALSGHFGPSRPVVLNEENNVTPHDEVVFNLDNGRALRYWQVVAPIENGNVYLLAHDSSKLDELYQSPITHHTVAGDSTSGMAIVKPLFSPIENRELRIVDRSNQIHELLNKALMQENIPRYYVAAIFTSIFTSEEQILDKAQ